VPNQKKPPGPKSRSPERAPAVPNVTDGGGAGLTPWTILQAAIKAVPALKYALGVLGIVSAITIIKVFGIDFRVAVFGTIIMVVLMVALVVFAALTKVRSPQVRSAALVLMWSFLVLTILSAAFLFTSAFFDYPKPLSNLLGGGIGENPLTSGQAKTSAQTSQLETTKQSETTAKDRLEIQKDYLPLVEDKSIAFHRRCLALAECINAEIFRDQVAFEKTAQLVYQAPKINEVPDSLAEERLAFPPLVQALSPLVAKNLEHLVQHYYDAESSPSFGQPDRSRQAGFWLSVFQRALLTYTDESLAAIATSNLLVPRFEVFNKLCVNLPTAIVNKMSAQSVPAIRGLAAVRVVSKGAWGSLDKATTDYVSAVSTVGDLVAAKADEEFLLSAQILRELRRPPVGSVEKSVTKIALDIVLDDGAIVAKLLQAPRDEHRSPRAERFEAASEYLKFAAEFEQVTDVVTDRLVNCVRDYEKTLQALETKLPDNGNGDLTARACIEALITLNYASPKRLVPAKERLPPSAFEVLSLVFGHSEKLLALVNLHHLRSKWQAALDGKELND
jgi:hypothetical protein